ncbi:hypothetical protein [Maridesulfovibrio sp.]|uniref:hypothetical protein n=1 Tax=Maridesulfovibrio sp. TaxID=2795000 RepID=UPI002AA6BA2A|nr:hypothetical protein [Maridesulfovibrio sp.]
MSISIGGFTATGPYTNTEDLQDRSGVYILLTKKNIVNNKWKVVDIGESREIRSRVQDHDREECWGWESEGVLDYAVIYTSGKQKAGRMEVEHELRAQYSPPCGGR